MIPPLVVPHCPKEDSLLSFKKWRSTQQRHYVHSILLLCTGVYSLFCLPSNGQNLGPTPSLAIHLSPQVLYDEETGAYHSTFYSSKIASSSQVTPDHLSTGLVETTFIRVGLRTKDFSAYDFRWGVGLLNMDYIRTPYSMGITLLEYAKYGLLEHELKWVNVRVGPSILLGSTRNYITLRTVGIGGITTIQPGTFSYAGLAPEADLMFRKRTYEFGYQGELEVFLGNIFYVSGAYSHKRFAAGLKPQFDRISGSVGVRINAYISLLGSYTMESAKAGSSTLSRFYISFSTGITI